MPFDNVCIACLLSAGVTWAMEVMGGLSTFCCLSGFKVRQGSMYVHVVEQNALEKYVCDNRDDIVPTRGQRIALIDRVWCLHCVTTQDRYKTPSYRRKQAESKKETRKQQKQVSVIHVVIYRMMGSLTYVYLSSHSDGITITIYFVFGTQVVMY